MKRIAFLCVLPPALVVNPTKSLTIEGLHPQQEVHFDGGKELPKIQTIRPASDKGKPALTVMSGLQVLENGQMKSYPFRISVKPQDVAGDAPDKPIEVVFKGDKPVVVRLAWTVPPNGDCPKATVKDLKEPKK